MADFMKIFEEYGAMKKKDHASDEAGRDGTAEFTHQAIEEWCRK